MNLMNRSDDLINKSSPCDCLIHVRFQYFAGNIRECPRSNGWCCWCCSLRTWCSAPLFSTVSKAITRAVGSPSLKQNAVRLTVRTIITITVSVSIVSRKNRVVLQSRSYYFCIFIDAIALMHYRRRKSIFKIRFIYIFQSISENQFLFENELFYENVALLIL